MHKLKLIWSYDLLSTSELKDIINKSNLNQKEKILMCLAVYVNSAKQVKEIKEIAYGTGYRAINKVNVSGVLANTHGLAIRTEKGWELTSDGRQLVTHLIGGPAIQVSHNLRKIIEKINDHQTKIFVGEAISCFEAKLYRASVVLSWIGAISLLYDFVIKGKLSEFNSHAKKRDPKWKDAMTKDDLARMKESDFLIVLESSSIIGKSVKQELEAALILRNGCGHPNSLKIGEHRVSGHIEILILNVFSKY